MQVARLRVGRDQGYICGTPPFSEKLGDRGVSNPLDKKQRMHETRLLSMESPRSEVTGEMDGPDIGIDSLVGSILIHSHLS